MGESAIAARAPLGPGSRGRGWLGFARGEWFRLAGFYGCIAGLHVGGWGLFAWYAGDRPALTGLGLAAYLFGLRHAFDADHIAAVDDTVRVMMQRGRRPLGVGFFFSLGHSSIVVGLAVAIVLSTASVSRALPVLEQFGGVIGAGVSGTFLWLIGLLNLVVLRDILRAYGVARSNHHDHTHVEELLQRRGFLNRLLGRRVQAAIGHSWQMYPLGLLFGLGFDTASEVGLLALSATASMGNVPVPAVLSLPILFTAGMALMDTTDGVLMCKAYEWSFLNPARRILYNLTTTSLSVAVALVIGTVELLQVLGRLLHLDGGLFRLLDDLYLGGLGYLVVGLLLLAWAISFIAWKLSGLEERHDPARVPRVQEHAHVGGVHHSHRHFR